jgi:hypothetical protein
MSASGHGPVWAHVEVHVVALVQLAWLDYKVGFMMVQLKCGWSSLYCGSCCQLV